MNRILLAVDLTDFSDELISTAIFFCKSLQAQMRVLHVNASAPYSFAPHDPATPVTDLSKEIDPSTFDALGNIHQQLIAKDIRCDFRKLDGPAESNILAAADEYEADLIVIGGHQHGHFYQCFFGTRTESVIRRAPCPVVVVPQHDGAVKIPKYPA